jgi:hypothetical protein
LPMPRLPPVIRAVRLRSGTVAPGLECDKYSGFFWDFVGGSGESLRYVEEKVKGTTDERR